MTLDFLEDLLPRQNVPRLGSDYIGSRESLWQMSNPVKLDDFCSTSRDWCFVFHNSLVCCQFLSHRKNLHVRLVRRKKPSMFFTVLPMSAICSPRILTIPSNQRGIERSTFYILDEVIKAAQAICECLSVNGFCIDKRKRSETTNDSNVESVLKKITYIKYILKN